MASLNQFIERRLRPESEPKEEVVARPEERHFLEFSPAARAGRAVEVFVETPKSG